LLFELDDNLLTGDCFLNENVSKSIAFLKIKEMKRRQSKKNNQKVHNKQSNNMSGNKAKTTVFLKERNNDNKRVGIQ
jgi:hypothetical protein